MMPEDRKLLYKLLEQWTRAEILGRLGPLGVPEYMQMHADHLEYEDKIRELLYGTSSLVELGEKWGLLTELKKAIAKKVASVPKLNPKKEGLHGKREQGRYHKSHRKSLL